MRINIHKEIFNDAFYAFLKDYNHRYEVYYGSAGSGKSHFVAQKLLLKALLSKRKVLVLRKVGRTVKSSVFQMLIDLLKQFNIYNDCKINQTDFTITLPNGSMFLCSGLDDSEKIKSIVGLTDIWMEEATDFNQDDFTQIDLRLRHSKAPGQQIMLSFNPVSKVNWCYRLFFSDELTDDIKAFRDKVFINQSTFKDNRFLPDEYVLSLKALKATNPAYYTIYALGEFGSLDKLVFDNFTVAEFDKNELKDTHLLLGLDFGYTAHPSAFVCSLLDEENKTIYIYEEMYKTGLLNNQIASEIKVRGYAKEVIMADAAEPKSIQEIKNSGVPRIKSAAKGQGSILQGIQKLKQYQLIIHPSCSELLTELNNYSWMKDKHTNEYINQPIDSFNHSIDALRYSLQCYEPNRKLSTLDIKLLGL